MTLHYLMLCPHFFVFEGNKGMIVKTNLKPRDYTIKEVIRIVNPKQYILYIKNGIFPIDVYTSIDFETNNNILVMVFLKEETADVYKKWCDYNLE